MTARKRQTRSPKAAEPVAEEVTEETAEAAEAAEPVAEEVTEETEAKEDGAEVVDVRVVSEAITYRTLKGGTSIARKGSVVTVPAEVAHRLSGLGAVDPA